VARAAPEGSSESQNSRAIANLLRGKRQTREEDASRGKEVYAFPAGAQTLIGSHVRRR
jgi:hypothetical protein